MPDYVVTASWTSQAKPVKSQRYASSALPFTIGRMKENKADVLIDDDHISTLHATIGLQWGQLCIRDETSTNGVYQLKDDGQLEQLLPERWYPIGPGAYLGTELRIQVDERVAESTKPGALRDKRYPPSESGGSVAIEPAGEELPLGVPGAATVLIAQEEGLTTVQETAVVAWRGLNSVLKRGVAYDRSADAADPEVDLQSPGDALRLSNCAMSLLHALFVNYGPSRLRQLELLSRLERPDFTTETPLEHKTPQQLAQAVLDFSKAVPGELGLAEDEEQLPAAEVHDQIRALGRGLESMQNLFVALNTTLEQLPPHVLDEFAMAFDKAWPRRG